ncbi:helicase [Penicillium sp. CMV-2018d]|nr:helicase [Penicillium sp. CMV-2018d]
MEEALMGICGMMMNLGREEGSPYQIPVRSPDLLSGVGLESDIFSHDLFSVPKFPAQHIGPDTQPEGPRLDDVQLRPTVITLPSEEPGNTFATQEGLTTDLETGVIAEQICFGMLVHEKVKLVGKGEHLCQRIAALQESNISRQVFQIQLSTDGEIFLVFPDATELGYLSERVKRTLKPLIGSPHFELEAWSTLNPIMDALSKAKTSAEAAIRVDIHVYGLEHLRDQVGRQLSKGNLFLQHPDMCRPGIRYDNPHFLRFDDIEDSDVQEETNAAEDGGEIDVSFECDTKFDETIATVFQSLRRPDKLNRLKETGNLIGSLYPHQEEALDFMTQRETGEITAEYRLWQPKTIGAEQVFSHVITHDQRQDKPDESGGGILADEMGMGKSLTTLVLIGKTTRDAHQWAAHSDTLPKSSLAGKPCRATLLIVPQQCTLTSQHGSLKMMIYHGRTRKNLLAGIDHYDLVITTYNTLAREHDHKLLGKGKSPLHDFIWYRVVLDEAHIIRRRETTFHKAVFNLEAKSRWCLSGTPIQNSLGDLASLLAFLKIRPFHETRTFRDWIGRPFEEKRTKQRAIQRLTALLNAICLRRTIDRVEIPGKKQETRIVQFSPEERAQYDRTYLTMQRYILQQAGEYNQQTAFGMFQVILQLRSFCNHGTYQHELSWVPRNQMDDEVDAVRSITRDSHERCLICRQKLPIVPRHRWPDYTKDCKHVLCDECAQRNNQATDPAGELHCPLCESLRGPQLNRYVLPGSKPMETGSSSRLTGQSSKMQALLSDVLRNLDQTKSIVFSCWTRTLDLIAKHFTEAGILFERIDGRTKPAQRQEYLDSFNSSSQIPVLIMTTGTGAFGLNLQSVNRVFIVEPQWNPSVEDQAISRAIRLGQEQQVVVVRYCVQNSIEEDMCTQQTHKLKISKMDFGKELISVPQQSSAGNGA